MNKRIPKRVREEAALICAIAASHPELEGGLAQVSRDLTGSSRIYTGSPLDVAIDAWFAVWEVLPVTRIHVNMSAEAAQLLWDGWSPGDPL